MKKSHITLFVLFLFISVVCTARNYKQKAIKPAPLFLKNLRASRPLNTWADMKGDIIQKRRIKDREYKILKSKIKVGILFTKIQAVAMIKLTYTGPDGTESEKYKVGQPYDGSPSTVLTEDFQENSVIGDYGISPDDFTMTFLYWKLLDLKQNRTVSVKGLKCRVLTLANSEKTEYVKIFASIEYRYPLKVEWFKAEDEKPYRTMVIESFTRDGELGGPDKIIVTGPGWKTKIDFENVKFGYRKKGIPKDLFK
ncbi:MAG: hypothetical protein K9L78_01090 [Victivallales bacterium]|nr:hypothetical protein [Victivallales bacterium]MCF7888692.1 hypothetical protein [Victivallales bacterium]